MDLKTYIREQGETAIAERLTASGCPTKPRTVVAWRFGERQPRPDTAVQLVAIADGALTLNDIYGTTPTQGAA